MNLIRWEPFNDLAHMNRAMDTLWQDAYRWPFRRPSGAEQCLPPAVDISETANEIVVKATLPGVQPEDVDIDITGNSLTIKGETKTEEETKDEKYIRKECHYGTFARSLSLPAGLETDKAEASMDNGVLTLTLPKAEKVKPKVLKVKAKKITDAKKVESKS